MRTVTLDVLDDNGMDLLKNLEMLKVIRFHDPNERQTEASIDLIKKYKGMMTKQSLEEIDQQLNELRNEWN